jgi:hypothetical protein
MLNFIVECLLILFTLISAGVAVRRKNYRCSIALLLSLACALGLLISSSWHPVVMFLCGCICILKVDKGRIVSLEILQNEVNYAVCFIYMFRILIAGMYSIPISPVLMEVLWILSTVVFLMLQNIIVFFGSINDNPRRFNNNITSFRSSLDDVFFSR